MEVFKCGGEVQVRDDVTNSSRSPTECALLSVRVGGSHGACRWWRHFRARESEGSQVGVGLDAFKPIPYNVGLFLTVVA